MRRAKYISRIIVNMVTPHYLWKLLGIIISAPAFLYGGYFI